MSSACRPGSSPWRPDPKPLRTCSDPWTATGGTKRRRLRGRAVEPAFGPGERPGAVRVPSGKSRRSLHGRRPRAGSIASRLTGPGGSGTRRAGSGSTLPAPLEELDLGDECRWRRHGKETPVTPGPEAAVVPASQPRPAPAVLSPRPVESLKPDQHEAVTRIRGRVVERAIDAVAPGVNRWYRSSSSSPFTASVHAGANRRPGQYFTRTAEVRAGPDYHRVLPRESPSTGVRPTSSRRQREISIAPAIATPSRPLRSRPRVGAQVAEPPLPRPGRSIRAHSGRPTTPRAPRSRRSVRAFPPPIVRGAASAFVSACGAPTMRTASCREQW